MKTTSITRLGSLIGAAALSVSTLAVGVGTASAAAVPGAGTANPAGWSHGYNDVLNGNAAAAFLVKVEGGDVVEVFCVDQGKEFDSNPDTLYTASTWSASGIPALDRASDLAVNSATKGTPLADINSEYVARQLAIWSFTNNTDYSSVQNAAIRNRATELKGMASTLKERPSSFVLTATTAQAEGKNTVTVTLKTGEGNALAGNHVSLKGTGIDKNVQIAEDGTASATFDAGTEAVKVTATWTGVLPSGTVLVPGTQGSQKVITVKDAAIKRTSEVTLAAAPAPAPVEPTPAKPAPAPAPAPEAAPPAPAPAPAAPAPAPVAPSTPKEKVSKELPYTGSPVTLSLMLATAGLLGFGAWSRKRNK